MPPALLCFPATLEQAQVGAISATELAATFYAEIKGIRPASDHPFMEQIELALGEACTNCARHRSGSEVGEIRVDMRLQGDSLLINIADRNDPFNPDSVPLPEFAVAENGYGLFLIRNCVDELSYQRLDGWNILTLIKQIPTND